MKKIGIVSFENEKRIQNAKRLEQLKEISEFATKINLTHILFPGSTLFHYKRNDKVIKKEIEKLVSLFSEQSIIFEASLKVKNISDKKPPYGVYAYEKGKQVKGGICQILVTSSDPKKKYCSLWNDLACTKNRLVKLDGIKVLVLICGELNILKNKQSNENKVYGLRYQFIPNTPIRNLKFDILHNPTHEPLVGLYGKYIKRLEYMSTKNRYAIINLNIPVNQIMRKGAFFCYKNGKKIVLEKSDWKNGWTMKVIDYKKK